MRLFKLGKFEINLGTRDDRSSDDSSSEVVDENFDIDDASSRPTRVNKIARSRGAVYNVSGRESDFKEADYNLNDVSAAVDTEIYFRKAVDRFVGEVWKNGWSFIGKDQGAVLYVRARIAQMAEVMEQPFEDLLHDVARQLIQFSNCFVEKIRDENASGGRRWTRFDGKEYIPIAGLKVLDATSMLIKRKDNGKPTKYQQRVPGHARLPEWPPENIIHLHYFRQVGLDTGTPFITPALDDIRALRNMEQNVEILVFQHAVPLFHYTVGTEDAPAQPGEIEALEAEIEEMPNSGVLITPERHKVVVLGAQGESINAEPYLQYFKTRVLSGVGLGSIAVGEGDTANRSTGSTINGLIQDTAKVFQVRIKIFIDQLIEEILREGQYEWDKAMNPKLVELFIPEIDVETKILKENHFVQLWMENAITSAEVRREMGRDPFTDEDWEDTHWKRIGEPKALIQSLDEKYVTTGNNNGPSVVGSTSKVNKSTANKNNPKNQHGSRGAPKVSKDAVEVLDEITEKVKDEHANLLYTLGYAQMKRNLMSLLEDIKADVTGRMLMEDEEQRDILLEGSVSMGIDSMMRVSDFYIRNALEFGARDLGYDGPIDSFGTSVLVNSTRNDYIRFGNDIQKFITQSLKVENPPVQFRSLMDTISYRLDFMARTQIMKAVNFGSAETAKFLGDKEIEIKSGSDEKHKCGPGTKRLDISGGVSLNLLPPYHPNCTCEVLRVTPGLS